jgi:hypothetical protein
MCHGKGKEMANVRGLIAPQHGGGRTAVSTGAARILAQTFQA